MKKIFRIMIASAFMIGAISCAKSEASLIPAGEEVEVTFVADLGSLGTRLIADGTTVDEVAWAIYEANKPNQQAPLAALQGTLKIENKQATFSTRLVTGKAYDIAFFAYKAKDAAGDNIVDPLYCSVDWATKSVTVDYSKPLANVEERDCFWHVEPNLLVNAPLTKTFTLKRPLAQLNFGVTPEDVTLAKKAGLVVTHSSVTVDTYTSFNLFDGSVSGPKTITFATNDIPDMATETLKVKVDGVEKEFVYLATTYVLVADKITSDVAAVVNDGTQDINTIKHTFVYLQRNWRTNIIGALLTSPANFTVVVDEKFVDDYIK